MLYWIEDHLGAILTLVVIALVALIIWGEVQETNARNDRFDAMLKLARTSSESLLVMTAKEKSLSDAQLRNAIISAGAASGRR